MKWLVGLMAVILGLLMLLAFSAVLISIAAGLLTSLVLWLPLKQWRTRQLQRAIEHNPALDIQQESRNHPAFFYVLSALVIWLGCAAMLLTLLHLPFGFFSPDQLSLGAGIAFLVSFATLLKLIGNLISVGQAPKDADETRATWMLVAGIVPMLTVIVLLFFVPHTAGWMAWREQWRGYASTQLRIPLQTDNAKSREALLQLVQPLLTQGSRVISYNARSRGGNSYTLVAAVPARYRFHDGALQVQLGGVMHEPQLGRHTASIELAASGDIPDPMLLAYGQCQPSPEKLTRGRMLSEGRKMMEEMRQCVHSKATIYRDSMAQLKGNLGPVEVSRSHFTPKWSNWLTLAGWKAVELPDEKDALQALDLLR